MVCKGPSIVSPALSQLPGPAAHCPGTLKLGCLPTKNIRNLSGTLGFKFKLLLVGGGGRGVDLNMSGTTVRCTDAGSV